MTNKLVLHGLSFVFFCARNLYYIYSLLTHIKEVFCRVFLYICSTLTPTYLVIYINYIRFVLHCSTNCSTTVKKPNFVVQGCPKVPFLPFLPDSVLVTNFCILFLPLLVFIFYRIIPLGVYVFVYIGGVNYV